MSIECVLFDYGGVVCPDQSPEGKIELAAMLDVDVNTFVRLWRQYRLSYDIGIIDGQEYWSRILRHTRVRDIAPNELIETEIRSWYGYDPAVFEWAARLRDAGIRTGVLSNMPIELAADTRKQAWIEPFEPLVFSAEIRKIKPDLLIYEHVIAECALPPDRILFLDDNAPNIRGAIRAGLNALEYRNLPAIATAVESLGLPRP